MAKAHLYVRGQVQGSNDDVQAIADAVQAVKTAVEAAGGDWNGDVHLQLDDEPELAPQLKPALKPEPKPEPVQVQTAHKKVSSGTKKR